MAFTRHQIDSAREHFSRQSYPEVRTKVGEFEFSYFVLPQSLNPSLPDFVFCMTGEKNDALYGVSDSVDEAFRPYTIVHEIVEYTKLPPSPDSCALALETELLLVPEAVRAEYVSMRTRFFRNLVEYALKNNYKQGDVEKFRKSLQKLEAMQQ